MKFYFFKRFDDFLSLNRKGVLDAYIFDTIDEVREISQKCVDDYNTMRPHDALGELPPKVYRKKNIQVIGLRYASATPSLHYAQQLE